MISDDPKATLPHRDPFLFVSRLIERADDGSKGVVEFDVKESLDLFRGHFPEQPIFPGVLQVEAAAQASLWVLEGARPEGHRPGGLFVSVESFKFKKPVVPPSVLRIQVEQVQKRASLQKWSAELFVDGKLVSSGISWLYAIRSDFDQALKQSK